jgi:hypothetical protein
VQPLFEHCAGRGDLIIVEIPLQHTF